MSSRHRVISSICLTPRTDNSYIVAREFYFTEIGPTSVLYNLVMFSLLSGLSYNKLNSRIFVTFSFIRFGFVRDDLVTGTMECAGSGTVAMYIAGTRDLDIEKQAYRGKNSQYV